MQELIIRNWNVLVNPEGLTGHWITGEEIGRHLGYAEPRKSVANLYSRNAESFKEGIDTGVITLMTPSGAQETRLFSERGCLKVTRFSRTDRSDEIMEEVFDIFLEAKRTEKTSPPPASLLPTSDQQALSIMDAWVRAGQLLQVPAHIAQQEAIKAATSKTGIDFSPLLLSAPAQNNIAKDEEMLEPADIGKLFGIAGSIQIRGKTINEFLAYMGWQERIDGRWEPTEKGKEYCTKHAWSVGWKTGYNLKWNLVAVRAAWELERVEAAGHGD